MVDLQYNTGKRWKLFNRVFLVIIVLIFFFGYMDALNLKGVFALDSAYQAQRGWDLNDNVWNIYFYQVHWMMIALWIGILAIIATVWYLVTKDKSETAAIFLVPTIWIMFGVQDLIYFLFSSQTLADVGCWANSLIPVSIMSDILGESCPTRTSFALSAIIGLFLSWLVLFKLKYLEPARRR